MPTLKTFLEFLPCVLTDDEMKSKELASLCEEIAMVEDEKAASAKQFNGKLGELETKRADLAREVRSGKSMREVSCADELIRDDSTVRTIRTDTGEPIRSRQAHPNELVSGKSLFDGASPEEEF